MDVSADTFVLQNAMWGHSILLRTHVCCRSQVFVAALSLGARPMFSFFMCARTCAAEFGRSNESAVAIPATAIAQTCVSNTVARREHATLRLIACARAHMCSAKVFVVMLSHAAACADSLMVCEQQPVCCKDFFRLASSDKHVFFTREKPREPTSTVCGVCLICVNDCTHVCGSELWSP